MQFSGRCPAVLSKNIFLKVKTVLDFFIHFQHAFDQWPNKLRVKADAHAVCNALTTSVAHCSLAVTAQRLFYNFLEKVGWNFILAFNLLWLVYLIVRMSEWTSVLCSVHYILRALSMPQVSCTFCMVWQTVDKTVENSETKTKVMW